VSERGNPSYRKGGQWKDGYARGRAVERDDVVTELERVRREADGSTKLILSSLIERIKYECHVTRSTKPKGGE
jgi:hypothetical protein